jgi:hypothetical protein
MKTWEKWYWGITLTLFFTVVLSISLRDRIKVVINNQTIVNCISKEKALSYFIPIYLSVFGLIWLIVKVISGGFSKK